MTTRGFYTSLLTELNTYKAPSLHLEDYLYFANKGVQEYVNLRYGQFSISQQLTDDLQALKRTETGKIINRKGILTVKYESETEEKDTYKGFSYNSDTLQFSLPNNYLHLLSLVTNLKTIGEAKCTSIGSVTSSGSRRLTSDVGANIMNNVYLRPMSKRTYFDISDNFIDNKNVVGMLKVFFGSKDKFSLSDFSLDYLKKPEAITLTIKQRDDLKDNSNLMEFPEYACNEIVKTTVKLILENQQNPRLQTNIPINTTIK